MLLPQKLLKELKSFFRRNIEYSVNDCSEDEAEDDSKKEENSDGDSLCSSPVAMR